MNGGRLSILVASPWLYPADKGGVGMSVRILIEALSPSMDISVLIPDWKAKAGVDDEIGGLEVRRMALPLPFEGGSRLKGLAAFALRAPRCMLSLRRFVRERRIDLVHINYATPNFAYFTLLRWLTGIPYVVTVHGSDVVNLKRQSRPDRALVRLLLRRAACVVAVSLFMADIVAEAVPTSRPATVVHNAIQSSPQHSARPPIALPARYFVSVGSFIPVKGWDVLLHALAMLPPEHSGVHLVLVGGGEPPAEHVGLVQELGISERVHFAGYTENAQVLALMRGAVAVVIPSRSEGLPLAAIEAGLCGKAVVGSRVGGLPEVVAEGHCGLLVPPEDPAALAEALGRVARDAGLAAKLGAAHMARVRERFSIDRLAQAYTRVYEKTLAEPRDGRAGMWSGPFSEPWKWRKSRHRRARREALHRDDGP